MIEKHNKKVLLANFFSLSTLQVINLVLPLFTLPYLIRVVGVDNFGLLAFATSFIIYFKIITDYGFNLTATREISINRDNNKKLIEIFSSVMSIKIILMIINFLLLSIIVFSFKKFNQNWEIYFLTFGTVVGQVLFPVWLFQGMEKMKYITYLNILSKLIFTIAIFIFVKEEKDFWIVPLLTSIGFLVAGIWSLFLIKSEFNIIFKFQTIKILTDYFKNGWNIFLVEFLPNIYNNFTTFFLGFFVSMEILGYYALATKLIDILNSFIRVIRNVTYPYLVRNISKFQYITNIMLGVGLLFTICTLILSHWIVPFIFGDNMSESLFYLYIISLSPLFLAITYSYGTNRLLVLKKDNDMKNITFQYSFFGFILALILIPIYGATGSAVTLILTRLLMSVLTYKKGKSL